MNIRKMNPEPKRLWIEALRSGEYKQCTGSIAIQDGEDIRYCCLGVLMEVARQNGVEGIERRPHGDANIGGFVFVDTYDGDLLDEGILLPRIAEWAGCDLNPIIGTMADADSIDNPVAAVEANDDRGWFFTQIADAVERNL